MEPSAVPQFFFNALSMLPQLLIVIACIYYISKKTTVDAILLTIGSFISLLLHGFNALLMPMLWTYDSGSFETRMLIIRVSSIMGFVAWALFGVGLLLLIIKQVKQSGK